MICHKLIIGQPVQQTGFSYGGISDYNQLKKEVLVLDALILEDFVLHRAQPLHELLWRFLIFGLRHIIYKL